MPIAKIVKGNTPAYCIDYVLDKEGSELYETNCVGRTGAEIAAEFDLAVQAQAQRQTRGRKAATTVYHTSIAFDLNAELTRQQKLEVAHRYLEGMGFERSQNAYVIAEHHDTQHQHLHLIASRVRWDGYTTPCWQDYQKAEAIMRQVETDYGLKPVISSRDAEVKAPTVAEVRRSRSTGQPIPRVVIQQALDYCLYERQSPCSNLVQLQSQLQDQDINLTTKPVTTRSGTETLALLFQFEHLTYSASKLGKRYGYKQLQATFEMNAAAAAQQQAQQNQQQPDAQTVPSLQPTEEKGRSWAEAAEAVVPAEVADVTVDTETAADVAVPVEVAAETAETVVAAEPAETAVRAAVVKIAEAAEPAEAAEVAAEAAEPELPVTPEESAPPTPPAAVDCGSEAAVSVPVTKAAAINAPAAVGRPHREWQDWLDRQPPPTPAPTPTPTPTPDDANRPPQRRADVPDATQQDWALWVAFTRRTDQWLQQKGIAPAPDSQGQRRLAQVALYCRLEGYAPEKVARALLISPCKVSYRDPKLVALNWAERDKERFALLKLMMKIDEQVTALSAQSRKPDRQSSKLPGRSR